MNSENIYDQTSCRIPTVGLGTASLEPPIAPHIVTEAVRSGYRHIDCAARYQNEASIGKAFTKLWSGNIVRRKDLFITSKLWCTEQNKADVLPACKRTLSDLQLDFLDLYLIHWPVRSKKKTPGIAESENVMSYSPENILETWREMEKLVDLGLCKYIGVSNFNISMLSDLIGNARIKPVVNQVELHPYLPQHKLVYFCQQNGILMTAYTPLGNAGRGSLYRNSSQLELLEDDVIRSIAQKHSISSAQVVLAWNIHRGVSVIPKTRHTERLKENLAASTIHLDGNDISALNSVKTRCRYVNFPWCQTEGINFWEVDD